MSKTFDSFFRSKIEQSDFCCNEQPQKPRKPEVHVVPALSTTAPAWSGTAIVNLEMKDISLNDYKGKYLIMLFYPYDFTFICPTEIIQFNDRIEEFNKLGCELVAISTDSPYTHLAWIITPRKQGGLGEMRMAVLSDKNQSISRMYGILDEEEGISLKGLFIIDKNQLIRHITINEICLSRSVDETLRILEMCKFVDEFGNTCPAGPRERLNVTSNGPNYFNI
ncbi:Peroxiredoxin 1 [Melipona quadrifasciata]|uniref:thioredoxin-dependent peroxiredoxin n=1 Tax=Melipona quadrifasciata TaxID=166423 RepID=A0A0M8ZYJ7_9HYME|nr:Peroxiredoxin 1 [Melipona quadrifasciata]